MKRSSFLGHQNNYFDWLKNEGWSIGAIIFTAILPPIISAIIEHFLSTGSKCGCSPHSSRHFHSLVEFESLFQAIFIIVALAVLISNMRKTSKMLKDNRKLFANYIEHNTNRRIRRCDEKDFSVTVVTDIAKQFYVTWIIVWILWLIYYLGAYFLEIFMADHNVVLTYKQVFDFFNSIAMFSIYLILSCMTTKREERADDSNALWYGVMFLVLLTTVWLTLICSEDGERSKAYQYCQLLTSVFSTISFVLVLGKLNSNYLQIPSFFLLAMYIYAIVQAYIPFAGCGGRVSVIGQAIQAIQPYATLFGKLFVMLTLCWIVDKKRLVFFIIHESTALEETPALLDELDNEPVEF